MIIRSAELSDARRIAEIQVEAWRTAYAGILPSMLLDRLSIDEREFVWKKRLSGSGRSITWVLWKDSILAGWAMGGAVREVDADTGDCSELYGIYFAPDFQGRGLGTELYRALERLLTGRAVVVWVLEANLRARRFYEKNGFVLEPERWKEEPFQDVALPLVRYRKELPWSGTE